MVGKGGAEVYQVHLVKQTDDVESQGARGLKNIPSDVESAAQSQSQPVPQPPPETHPIPRQRGEHNHVLPARGVQALGEHNKGQT